MSDSDEDTNDRKSGSSSFKSSSSDVTPAVSVEAKPSIGKADAPVAGGPKPGFKKES